MCTVFNVHTETKGRRENAHLGMRSAVLQSAYSAQARSATTPTVKTPVWAQEAQSHHPHLCQTRRGCGDSGTGATRRGPITWALRLQAHTLVSGDGLTFLGCIHRHIFRSRYFSSVASTAGLAG